MQKLIDQQNIKAVSSVKLLRVEVDSKLNFNLYISNICKSATNQLSDMQILRNYLSFDARKLLINSYFISNFKYCPLVWISSSTKSLTRIQNLQKRTLPFLLNNYVSSYVQKCVEINKTINDLNKEQKELNLDKITK